MASSGIKATVGIDGASKFRNEMRNMKQSLKELDSELKLADSQFKATGNSEQYMADKSSILHKQLETQNQIVKALEERLKTATAQYGENSTQVSKLRTELNKAKTQQNNLKSAIAETEDPLKTATESTGEFATSTGEAATSANDLDTNLQAVVTHLDLEAVAKFASNVSSAIEGAAKKAKELGTAVWNLGTEAGSTADSWITMSKNTGISVEDIQKWSYAGRFVDTTLENITGSMVKFRTKFSDVREAFDELEALQGLRANTKGKKELEQIDKRIESIQEKAKTLKNDFGVDIYDAQHNLKSTVDLYWEMIDVIGKAYNGDNKELAEQAAMEWFGRSAANLNPLFEAGKDAFMELGEEAQQLGYIMSQEDVDALGSFDDQIQKLQASMEALKLNMANELLPLLQPIADGFLQISDSLLAYIQSEDGQKAISDMASSVGTVLSSISEGIPEAISTVTGYINDFAGGFTNAETAVKAVIDAVKTLAAVWAASKLVSFGANMINATETIGRTVKGWLGGGSTPTPTPTPTTTVPKGTSTASKTGWNFLTTPIAKIVGGLTAGLVTLNETLIQQTKDANQRSAEVDATGRDADILARAQELGQTLDEAKSIIAGDMFEWNLSAEDATKRYLEGTEPVTELWDASKDEQGTRRLAYSTDVYADALKRLDGAMQDLEDGNGDFWLKESIAELQGLDVKNIFDENVLSGLFDVDSIPAEEIASWIQALHDQLAEAAGQMPSAGEEIGKQAAAGVASAGGAMASAGAQAMAGLTVGIRSGGFRAMMAASAVASGIATAVRNALKIHSPSQVMAELGRYTVQGFADGIEGGIPSVNGAMQHMLGAVNSAPVYGSIASTSGGTASEGIIAALNGAQVVMDGETVGRLIFPYVNAEMGETIARRYAS